MVPQKFRQSNITLQRPKEMTDEECSSLDIFSDNKVCVSCWKPTFRERLSILIHGRIWLGVLSGQTQPPVWLDGSKSVFRRNYKHA